MAAYQLVLTTCPDAKLAETLARALVEDRLAACINIVSSVQSVYRWKGRVESASERLLIIKIRAADYAAVQRRIGELHSYELPEAPNRIHRGRGIVGALCAVAARRGKAAGTARPTDSVGNPHGAVLGAFPHQPVLRDHRPH